MTVPRPIGHDGVTYAGTHAGFLGPRHDPLEFSAAPNSRDAAPACLRCRDGPRRHSAPSPAAACSMRSTTPTAICSAGPAAESLRGFYEQAFRMVASPAARRAFDLDLEPPARPRPLRPQRIRRELPAGPAPRRGRRSPGDGDVDVHLSPRPGVQRLGQPRRPSASTARSTGYDLLEEPRLHPAAGPRLRALLEDLHDRGLLDETLVVAVGEFGRTPKINAAQGRDHWGACQSALLAGGGIRGGQVYGASDAHAAYVKDNPVSPEDLLATIYHALGLSRRRGDPRPRQPALPARRGAARHGPVRLRGRYPKAARFEGPTWHGRSRSARRARARHRGCAA